MNTMKSKKFINTPHNMPSNYPPNINLYEKQIEEEPIYELDEDREFERVREALGNED